MVRAFRRRSRGVFSGTPRVDTVTIRCRASPGRFDAAADTVRFPRTATMGLGAWTPSKFYRAARFNPTDATLTFNVGELSPFRGMTYAEIASESRSQHLSQGFGALQRRGTSMDYVKLEASHVSPPIAPERSMFETLGTGWGRFHGAELPAAARSAVDSLGGAIADGRKVGNLAAPAPMVAPLARVVGLLARARAGLTCPRSGVAPGCFGVNGDLALSLETAERRAQRALLSAAGVQVEATAPARAACKV